MDRSSQHRAKPHPGARDPTDGTKVALGTSFKGLLGERPVSHPHPPAPVPRTPDADSSAVAMETSQQSARCPPAARGGQSKGGSQLCCEQRKPARQGRAPGSGLRRAWVRGRPPPTPTVLPTAVRARASRFTSLRHTGFEGWGGARRTSVTKGHFGVPASTLASRGMLPEFSVPLAFVSNSPQLRWGWRRKKKERLQPLPEVKDQV